VENALVPTEISFVNQVDRRVPSKLIHSRTSKAGTLKSLHRRHIRRLDESVDAPLRIVTEDFPHALLISSLRALYPEHADLSSSCA